MAAKASGSASPALFAVLPHPPPLGAPGAFVALVPLSPFLIDAMC